MGLRGCGGGHTSPVILRTHPAECIHHHSPCVTFGKVLENSETRVLVEIWNPFQSYTGRKLGIEQQSPQFVESWGGSGWHYNWGSFFFLHYFVFHRSFSSEQPLNMLENTTWLVDGKHRFLQQIKQDIKRHIKNLLNMFPSYYWNAILPSLSGQHDYPSF